MSKIKTKCTLGYAVCGLIMHDHKLLLLTNDKGACTKPSTQTKITDYLPNEKHKLCTYYVHIK